jgi:hypothetical protein
LVNSSMADNGNNFQPSPSTHRYTFVSVMILSILIF